MNEGEAAAACLAWNRHNTPPLPEDKIRSTVESIAKAEAKKRAASLQVRGDDSAAVLTKIADQSFQNGDDAEIGRLAQLRPLVYERERKEAAKRLGCRESILDKLIRAARGEADDAQRQGRPLDLHEPDPWPQPVDGQALLSEISATFSRYVVMSRAAADAAALWVLHAYLIDVADATPRLAIKSSEKRCGKTTLLSVIAGLAPRVLATSNISPAALFRTIEAAKPTLLIDEADTFVAMSDELRGIINSESTTTGLPRSRE
jgi:putative DNA primase/helicase